VRAFALKDNVGENFAGSIAVPPEGRTLDVGARMKAGDGVIVTSDEVEGSLLANFPGIKELQGSERDAAVKAKQAPAKSADKTSSKGGD
jgi:hypothetical protein